MFHLCFAFLQGYVFKTEIDEYFSRSQLHTKLLPFVNTTEGSKVKVLK